ncbi:MAG TPA: deoxynucleoside kinase [Methylophilaceae bacterium]
MNVAEKYPYIVIEGPIGSGKTTLAKRMAERLSAQLLLENAAENPFLERFYQNPERHALPTQLFFLFQRTEQLRKLSQPDLFGGSTIADFFLEKDPLFARLTLNDEEFALYRNIYQHVQLQIPPPDLVIYLQTSTDILLERVEKRGIDYEKGISRDYLEKLAASYSDFFHQYQSAPLLIVNNEHLDVATSDEALELLMDRMLKMRGPREYFNPNLE